MGVATAEFNPLDNPELYDCISVGGVLCPGFCKIGDVKRKNSWDVKKGKGTLGGTITFVGREPVTFTVTFYLWLPSHFVAWGNFRKQFDFDPTKTAVTATSVFHPQLDDIDISSVVIEHITPIQHQGKNLYTIEVGMLEYFPPPKKAASGTPNGTKNGSASGANKPPGTPTDPIATAQQAEIAKLLAQAQGP